MIRGVIEVSVGMPFEISQDVMNLSLDDNIMITDDGKILHIDFGCAFGQKTKLERLLGIFMDIPHSPFSEDVFIGNDGSAFRPSADEWSLFQQWSVVMMTKRWSVTCGK